jgi:hypothetical protein
MPSTRNVFEIAELPATVCGWYTDKAVALEYSVAKRRTVRFTFMVNNDDDVENGGGVPTYSYELSK